MPRAKTKDRVEVRLVGRDLVIPALHLDRDDLSIVLRLGFRLNLLGVDALGPFDDLFHKAILRPPRLHDRPGTLLPRR